jgi:hypothetical protein
MNNPQQSNPTPQAHHQVPQNLSAEDRYFDVSEMQLALPEHAHGSLTGPVSSNSLLTTIMSLLLPIALQMVNLNPALLALYQQWQQNQGDPRLSVGEIVHGLKLGKLKNIGVEITLVRHPL